MTPSERLVYGFSATLGCAELEFGAMVICRYLAAHGDKWDFPILLTQCRAMFCSDDRERANFDVALNHGHSGALPEHSVDHRLADLLCCGTLSKKTIQILSTKNES